MQILVDAWKATLGTAILEVSDITHEVTVSVVTTDYMRVLRRFLVTWGGHYGYHRWKCIDILVSV